MKVVGNNVAVTDLTPAEKTAGGLFVPGTAESALVLRGKVVAVSNELKLDGEVQVKEGDLIQYIRHNAFSVDVSGAKYKVLTYKDILIIE